MYECTNFINKYIRIEITDNNSLYHLEDADKRKGKVQFISVEEYLRK